jgi:hypothetical protein
MIYGNQSNKWGLKAFIFLPKVIEDNT